MCGINRRKAADTRLPEAERADALWEAARIRKCLGWVMFGEGNDGPKFRADAKANRFIPYTAAEQCRNRARRVLPEGWYYPPFTYDASHLAWRATKMMPEDTDLLARRLNIAGDWTKHHDAKYADRFYQDIVRRAFHTDLGLQAEIKRWFPKGVHDDDWWYAEWNVSLSEFEERKE